MKKAGKSAKTVRIFEQLISKFSENEILSTHAMSYVRGGEGEGNGNDPITILPKPPK
jgi:hypothetical protein